MQDVLQRILRVKEGEVAALRPYAAELRSQAADAPPVRGFASALREAAQVQLLAEIKRRSPSAGAIRDGAHPGEVARAYERGGAAALSVLTDSQFFGGDLDALRSARAATSLPVLRKDFIVDAFQLWEARAAGADAVLLIVRALDQARLGDLLALAAELGMDALVEAHTLAEVERALAAGVTLLGVNNRDLATFTTDLALSEQLVRHVPAAVTFVAESGIRTSADVERLGACGVDAVLVGEALMRQPDITAAARALVGRPKLERAQ
ncbi:MAG: indole-3-glycerol phosphate synthase TrpC [Gemmatimonadetes bacterium]|nr:indole-3-glycerol phosphate synthase TrpC [Gemmatimonadota bacterium]